MPESSNNDIAVSDLSDVDRSVIAAEKTDVELMPHPTQTTVTQNGATDTDEAHAESAHAEDIQPDDAHMQPALNLATEHDAVILAAETESGALLVRAGDMAMSMPGMLESLLFVADAPVEATQLARVLNAPVEVVESHLRRLAEEYHAQGRGLRVAERNGRFQMVTAPAAATLIEAFLNLDMTTKLSAPALETLAVVAYRQPVTRAQVEAVRGVDCSGILRSLLQRGLVEEVDRLDAPGRPVRYGVTDLFMQHFGLTGLHELPPLESVEAEQLDGALEREA
jgi:segregation and condensation protein B